MKKTIKKAPIREQIYEIIKNDIMIRRYNPGDKLSIASISKELDVSNSPVREAISMLERDGLVETYPNAGSSVISMSQQRLAHIADAIAAMLLGAFEICERTGKIDTLISMMQDALKVQLQHIDIEDEQEYVRYSIAFEFSLIKCCENPYIARQYSQIADLFCLIVLYDQWYIDTNRRVAMMEHQNILGAIMDGDFVKAKELLYNHYHRFSH